ncbi:MAG: glycosyltransferase [Thermoanaerobaculales bacterium]|nr:glycosyltransferase [Thermoanaerobaculales bacterium]
MRTALVIPSLGAPHLERCLDAVAALDPAPDVKVLVLSGGAAAPARSESFDVHRHRGRLGFAAAVNAAISVLPGGVEAVAVLNDDALPDPGWLGALVGAFERDPQLAAVQGTVVAGPDTSVDGRGIEFDRWGLAVQIDRGLAIGDDQGERPVLAISGTAGLYRVDALRQAALPHSEILDPHFDCYHEDLDLGLRLFRLGRRARWIGGARTVHLGSASGPSLRWRHPWWVLANRWRALAGNLSPSAFLGTLPRLLRGEIRAVRALSRSNWRALPVAAAVTAIFPLLVVAGWRRQTPGPRLNTIPEAPR